MNSVQQLPEAQVLDRLVQQGCFLLKAFHDEYKKSHTGRETEFWRGEVAGFRHTLDISYGAATTQRVVTLVKQTTNLPMPHCGQLSTDGSGYLGFDSGCDM